MSKARGFTLVELIVVIVILGILAATALPRFVNLTGEAKFAKMQGLAGGLRAAVETTRGKWFAVGSSTATTVTAADGTTIAVGTSGGAAGVPTGAAGGIDNALGSTAGYSIAFGATTTFTPTEGSTGTCEVTYVAATGTVAINASASACQ